MNDCRLALKEGYEINYRGISIVIKGEIGRGGNSVVYSGEYRDTVVENAIHRCVIKELFPYDPKGAIRRDGEKIVHDSEADELWNMHKKSFIHGNCVHLNMLYRAPESVGANIDSFEANSTLYTILGFRCETTLADCGARFKTVGDVAAFALKLLDELKSFHKNSILHLDISPDNILLSDSSSIMLIDFNGCFDTLNGGEAEYISMNPYYSPPELRLKSVKDICEASDLFSVCGVIVFLITGRRFEYVGYDLRRLKNESMVRSIPPTAMQCLTGILRKGLRANPHLRFQSIAELQAELNELVDRIGGCGVTHSALWEISNRTCKNAEDEMLENKIQAPDAVYGARQLVRFEHCVLTGEGGIGKTTLLRLIQAKGCGVYNPNEPVYFFVPLRDFDLKSDFIKRYIVSKIKYNSQISTVDDAMHRLVELMEGEKPFIHLLLDGYNEADAQKSLLLKEIKALAAMRGVKITLTSRNSIPASELPSDFIRLSLLPIDSIVVRDYLNKNNLAYPTDDKLAQILRNPLILKLYTRTNVIRRDSAGDMTSPSSADEIIDEYLKSLCEAKKASSPGDAVGQLRLEYALKILLPALSAKGADINPSRLRRIFKADYHRLTTSAFQSAFGAYSGKTPQLKANISSAEEWQEVMLNKILIHETALVYIENGRCHIVHQNFADCLKKVHASNMRLYKKALLKRLIPKGAAALIVCGAVAAGGIYLAPHTHPIGRTETMKNTNAFNILTYSVTKIENMISYERIFIEQIIEGNFDAAAKSITTAKEYIDSMDYTAADASPYAYRTLDTDAINHVGEIASEHYLWQQDVLSRFSRALSPNGIYPDEYLINAARAYENYLDTLENLTAAELYLITEPISEAGRSSFLTSLAGTSIGVKYAETVKMDRDEAEKNIVIYEKQLEKYDLEIDKIR